MPGMRPETFHAGDYLLRQLRHSGTIDKMLHDGGDIVLFLTPTGQRVSIHMIESGIPLYEIRKIITENTAQDTYTLFMLWCSMMVPDDGQIYKMSDWMQGFIALNGDRVYAYDIFDSEVYLFSVYFHQIGDSMRYRVEYGTTVRAGRLKLSESSTAIPDLGGVWKVARFGDAPYNAQDVMSGVVPLSGLEAAYALLGIEAGDDRETVKQAYRLLARRYHPDQNPEPTAHQTMQRLNEAYQKVLDALEQSQK